jgi:carboxypeptidase D
MLKTSLVSAPLKGIIMGNPWLDPEHQYPAYLQFAYQTEMLQEGSIEAEAAEAADRTCNASLAAGGADHVLVRECEPLVDVIFPKHAA